MQSGGKPFPGYQLNILPGWNNPGLRVRLVFIRLSHGPGPLYSVLFPASQLAPSCVTARACQWSCPRRSRQKQQREKRTASSSSPACRTARPACRGPCPRTRAGGPTGQSKASHTGPIPPRNSQASLLASGRPASDPRPWMQALTTLTLAPAEPWACLNNCQASKQPGHSPGPPSRSAGSLISRPPLPAKDFSSTNDGA